MGRKRNLIGQRFERLTVIEEGYSSKSGSLMWLCRCDCGTEKYVRSDSLLSGRIKSCGCYNKDVAKAHLEGQRFGFLTVIKENGRNKDGDVMWLCRCDCGNEHTVKSVNLIHGYVKSCGCKTGEMISQGNSKHGLCNSKLYHIWSGIKKRCLNPKHDNYKRYGARNISMCDEWLNNFQVFYDWAISHGFQDGLTIDRIDNYKGYSPDNCRWITPKEQQHNRRDTIFLTYKGETKSTPEWAEIVKIDRHIIRQRIKAGWSVERTLETPVRKLKRRETNE